MATLSNGVESKNHAIMSETIHMMVASVCDDTSELDSPLLHGVLCTSGHAAARATSNPRLESISVGLAMCCNDGWWNDAARQMQEEAPLENGRNVSSKAKR